jgi:hypothetical protein
MLTKGSHYFLQERKSPQLKEACEKKARKMVLNWSFQWKQNVSFVIYKLNFMHNTIWSPEEALYLVSFNILK